MPAIGAIIGASMIPLTLQPFIQKAAQLVLDDCSFILSIKDNIDNLQGTFLLIESVLEKVKDQQVESNSIRDWLRQLVDIGYEARDVLDEYYTVTFPFVEERMASRSVSSSSFFRFGSSSPTLPYHFRFRISHEIKSVMERLDRMMKQKEILKLQESGGGRGDAGSTSVPHSRPECGPFVDKQKKNYFVGREKEKQEIIEKLMDDSNNLVRVVPIWGMGGVGKTTLARSVFNDDEVNKKYQTKIWLSVGDKKFNGKDIMSKIVGEYNVNELVNKLLNKLKGDKFLIVLDDVWELERSEWKLLWDPLTNVGKGGCIVITTRAKDVFTETNSTVDEDGIKPLSFSDCWLIFESHAFVDGNSDVRPDLKQVGQEIVKKLKGLPLAAEVVGCSLLNEQNVEAWKDFLEVGQWNLRNDKDDIMHALRWSYNRLPSYLKQCFAYCSLFPKDHLFDKKMLIEMWMAHDFIQWNGGTQNPEDIGGSYFKKLVHASLFQTGYGESYVMHDMIHDLALLVSNEEFNVVNGSPQNIAQMEKSRHVCIVSKYNDPDNYLENLRLCKSKRILTMYTKNTFDHIIPKTFFDKDIFRDIFEQLKSIRVLVLACNAVKDIPDCISHLIHLRYLDLSKTNIKTLPDCLCKLHNLQTMAIPLDAVLQKNIVNMANLRRLRANLTIGNGFGKLTSLQKLSSISISKDTNVSELGNMPKQLHGKLVIRGLENVTNLQDAGEGILKDKIHINRLELVREDETKFMTEEVLNVLCCPPNLTDLTIYGYDGRSLSWMSNVMRSLSKLEIYRCDGLTLKFDAFVSLKVILIISCSNLTTISFGATVECLHVYNCMKLMSMESESTSSLKSLALVSCKELKSLMDLQRINSLEKLAILRCPKLMIVEASTPSLPLSTLHTDKLVLFTKVFEYNNHVRLEIMDIHDFGFKHFSESVVNSWHKLTFLQNLYISHCGNLKSLFSEFQNLSSLLNLQISFCPQLQLLPADGLPLSLKTLIISDCPLLREQCRVDSEHWHKFEHIPDITVDYQRLERD